MNANDFRFGISKVFFRPGKVRFAENEGWVLLTNLGVRMEVALCNLGVRMEVAPVTWGSEWRWP